MRIFNEDNTTELTDVDLEKGYLKDEKLLIKHHEAMPFKKGKTAQEIAKELEADGVIIEIGYGDNYYRIVKEYENGGRESELIKDEPDTPAAEAYDEYENIQVYIPFMEDELRDRTINRLRSQRESECFPYINRGQLWYENLSEEQREELKVWYKAWLDVTETLIVPTKPDWLSEVIE